MTPVHFLCTHRQNRHSCRAPGTPKYAPTPSPMLWGQIRGSSMRLSRQGVREVEECSLIGCVAWLGPRHLFCVVRRESLLPHVGAASIRSQCLWKSRNRRACPLISCCLVGFCSRVAMKSARVDFSLWASVSRAVRRKHCSQWTRTTWQAAYSATHQALSSS